MNTGYHLRASSSALPAPVTTQVSHYSLVENLRPRSYPRLGAHELATYPSLFLPTRDPCNGRCDNATSKASSTHTYHGHLQCECQPITSTRGQQPPATQIKHGQLPFCRSSTCRFTLRNSLLLECDRHINPSGDVQIRKDRQSGACDGAQKCDVSNKSEACTTTNRENVRGSDSSKSRSNGTHKPKHRRFKAQRHVINHKLDQKFITSISLEQYFHRWRLLSIKNKCAKLLQQKYRQHLSQHDEWYIV